MTSRPSTNLTNVAIDAFSGDLYIADGSDNSVTMISSDTDIITIIAGDGFLGFNTHGSGGYSGDGGLAALASLNGPTSLTVDAARELLYIADTGNNAVRMVVKSTGKITTIAGLGVAGYSGDGGQATSASMSQPRGTAVDPTTGNLYIADTGNNIIRMVVKSTGVITTVAGSDAGLGGYTGDGGPATSALLNCPTGLAFSSTNGNLYIADTGSNVVRMLTKSTDIITTVAGNGHASCSEGGELVPSISLNMPSGLAIDAEKGILYIADSGNNAIRMLNSAGILTTVVGDNLSIDKGCGGPVMYAELNFPHSIALDASSGMLHIVDSALGTPTADVSSPTLEPTVTGKVY